MQMSLHVVEFLMRWFIRRPRYLTQDVPDAPDDDELPDRMLLREVRDGYAKWAHLRCPKCGENIILQLAGDDAWTIKTDILRRPTVSPSIWQTGSCGAHFFVRRGDVVWCASG